MRALKFNQARYCGCIQIEFNFTEATFEMHTAVRSEIDLKSRFWMCDAYWVSSSVGAPAYTGGAAAGYSNAS